MSYLQGSEGATPSAGCIFCAKAENGDDAAEHIVVRGQWCYVTLNRFPYNNGHVMVIPYAHAPSIEQLQPEELVEMMTLAQQALAALRAAYRPEGFNMGINISSVAGAGVADHVHMHIVPRWAGDTNYMTVTGETRVIPELLDDTYKRLRQAWNASSPPAVEST